MHIHGVELHYNISLATKTRGKRKSLVPEKNFLFSLNSSIPKITGTSQPNILAGFRYILLVLQN